MNGQESADAGSEALPRQLHAADRRLDVAFAAIGRVPDAARVVCLGSVGRAAEPPPLLRDLLPTARWIPVETHALAVVEPADHLAVHQCWLEASYGPTRVATATVRTTQPLVTTDDREVDPPGSYHITLVDLVGTPAIDAVVVVLEAAGGPSSVAATAMPGRGAASFRLRLTDDGVITSSSADVAGLLGTTADHLVGTRFEDLIHSDDVVAASGPWQDLLADPERAQASRLRLRHASGAWRWFMATSRNALADPATASVLTELQDIHDAVEAELALHASELGYRTLAESMPVGVALLDEDGRVHFANHRMVTILMRMGLAGPGAAPPTRDVGPGFTTRWADLLLPSFVEEVRDLVRPRPPDGSDPPSRQVHVDGPDGTTYHLLVKAATIDGDEGRRVIVTVQDVTDHVRTSRAHDRLVQVVDEVDDIVIVTDIHGNVSYLNQAANRHLGHELIGQSLRDAMQEELRAFTDAAIVPALRRSARWSGDVELVRSDGRFQTMATSVRPVMDPDRKEHHLGITMRDVTGERAHARELASQARHDPLTGLPNRTALMELLEILRRAPGPDVAMYFIDLDNLKIVNDGLGHGAGDQLLVAVAEELQRLSLADGVARFGGDEFVVVASREGTGDAMATAEQLLAAVRRVHVPGVASHMSASIGVAMSSRAGLDPEALVRDADAAMYAAKRAGRNRCALFDETLRDRAQRRFVLESSLREALTGPGLDVHYQPVVDMASGLTSGIEALSRWSEAAPKEFIPVAEDSGLIVPLGHAVLVRSLRDAATLRASGPEMAELRLGVNLSARELDEPGFAVRTLAAIEASDVPAEHVVLELTESVLIDTRDDIARCLEELRDAGIQLALDDFGMGYSSLNYLRRYPIEILKLDVSYTQAAVTDPGTRVIVEAMVSMANRLGLRVVAEGVETQAQFELVCDLGCTWGQGYLLGRPAPLEDLLAGGLDPELSSEGDGGDSPSSTVPR